MRPTSVLLGINSQARYGFELVVAGLAELELGDAGRPCIEGGGGGDAGGLAG